MKILFVILFGQSESLNQAPEGFLLQLLFHLNLAQVKEEFVSTFNLPTCLFNQLLNLTNSLFILVGSTSQHIGEDISKLIFFLGLGEKILIEVY